MGVRVIATTGYTQDDLMGDRPAWIRWDSLEPAVRRSRVRPGPIWLPSFALAAPWRGHTARGDTTRRHRSLLGVFLEDLVHVLIDLLSALIRFLMRVNGFLTKTAPEQCTGTGILDIN